MGSSPCKVFARFCSDFLGLPLTPDTPTRGGTFKPLAVVTSWLLEALVVAMGCRKSITNSEKLAILREWQRSSATGASLHSFADANNIRPFQLRRWVKLEQRLLESRPDATTVGRGGTPIFVEEQEEAILMWIVEKSDAGIGT